MLCTSLGAGDGHRELVRRTLSVRAYNSILQAYRTDHPDPNPHEHGTPGIGIREAARKFSAIKKISAQSIAYWVKKEWVHPIGKGSRGQIKLGEEELTRVFVQRILRKSPVPEIVSQVLQQIRNPEKDVTPIIQIIQESSAGASLARRVGGSLRLMPN